MGVKTFLILVGVVAVGVTAGSSLSPKEVEEIRNFASKAYATHPTLLDQQVGYSHYVGRRVRDQQALPSQQEGQSQKVTLQGQKVLPQKGQKSPQNSQSPQHQWNFGPPPRPQRPGIFQWNFQPFQLLMRRPSGPRPPPPQHQHQHQPRPQRPQSQSHPQRPQRPPGPPPQWALDTGESAAVPSLSFSPFNTLNQFLPFNFFGLRGPPPPRPFRPQSPPPQQNQYLRQPSPGYQLGDGSATTPHPQNEQHFKAIIAHQVEQIQKERNSTTPTPPAFTSTTEYAVTEMRPHHQGPPPPPPHHMRPPTLSSFNPFAPPPRRPHPFMIHLPPIITYHQGPYPHTPPPTKAQISQTGWTLMTDNTTSTVAPVQYLREITWDSARLPERVVVQSSPNARPLPLTPQQQKAVFTAAADSSMQEVPLVHSHHDEGTTTTTTQTSVSVSVSSSEGEGSTEGSGEEDKKGYTMVTKTLPGGRTVRLRKIKRTKPKKSTKESSE